MEVNLGYLDDILTYMIEGQYLEKPVPEDYLIFINYYLNNVHAQRSDESTENFLQGLKFILKAILNKPYINYEKIFSEAALHGTGSQDRAKKIFELIWYSFFEDEDWKDINFSIDEIVIVNKPFT